MTTPATPSSAPSGSRAAAPGAGATPRRSLVIVESPAKAKKIAGYLGDGFTVESSIGHIRDLPRSAADVPAAIKGQPWARLGIEVDNGFKAHYVVSDDKKDQVKKLKALLKNSDELLLATDEDREGEAIAWHLLDVLQPKVPVRRMVFHEITKDAIQRAATETRELAMDLVHAQETRRLLDRLYGYEVSPVLWKKVMPKLSAGRVQSVATRIIVSRERERMAFVTASYWDATAELAVRSEQQPGAPTTMTATLTTVDGRRLATGASFGPDGRLKTSADVEILGRERAERIAASLTAGEVTVTSVETRPYTRKPYAPFMTSTLQQEGQRKLHFTSERTMQIAQRLYENGHITYMRTDSTTLSETAVTAARDAARTLYGDTYVPASPRSYNRKVKNAQEAHEAIRPSGDSFRTPGDLAGEVSRDEFRLYELIWQRTVASQMSDATGTSATIRLAGVADGSPVTLSASGRVITFDGFLRAYVEDGDDPDAEREDAQRRLPVVADGETLDATEVTASGHSTSPPSRYTDASLVKAMEEMGIGRPSTYASIISTIQARGYVWKKGSALVPSWTAFAVVHLLEVHFGRLVDYGFTASLEDDLDAIAAGTQESVSWLTTFYFGGGAAGTPATPGPDVPSPGGLKQLVTDRLAEIDAREINSIDLGSAADGEPVVVRVGRFGPYVQHGDDRASLPEELAPDELTVDLALELLAAPSGDRTLGVDPVSGLDIVAKAGRYGPYVSEVLPEGSPDRPRTASLFKTMTVETVSLEQALALLTLPRVLGVSDGEEVRAQNGRYGPYVSKGKESRSLESEEQLLTIDEAAALALLAMPKQRGARGAAKPPLADLGPDPESGRPMVVKDGRFGAYVTDGETNATLRRGDDATTITPERGAELLAEKRAKGPAPAKVARKAPVKKAPTKKAAAKKVAKPAARKKTAAVKVTAGGPSLTTDAVRAAMTAASSGR